MLLPRLGRNERRFATEVGNIIGPLNVVFIHEDRVVEIFNDPVPADAKNRLDRNKLARGGLKFSTFSGPKTKGWLEQYLTPGHMVKVLDDNGKPIKDEQGKTIWEFKEQTMSEPPARAFIENPFFKERLPQIYRVLPVSILFLLHRATSGFQNQGSIPNWGFIAIHALHQFANSILKRRARSSRMLTKASSLRLRRAALTL